MDAMIICLLLIGSVVWADDQCKGSQVPEDVIQRLFDLVLECQVRTEDSSVPSQTNIGSYKDVIKFNSFGDPWQTVKRWAINFDDKNFYTPMHVTMSLLEAHFYGGAAKPSDDQLISTLEYASTFLDKTRSFNNSLIRYYRCDPEEGNQICVSRPKFLHDIFTATNSDQKAGATKKTDLTNLEGTIHTLGKLVQVFTGFDGVDDLVLGFIKNNRFKHSHPDADDTLAWLALGSLLKMSENHFPLASSQWTQYNPNISSIFDALKVNSYRPFSTDPAMNTINPVSYYALRDFLDDAYATGNDVALFSVWFAHENEKQAKGQGDNVVKFVNTIDVNINTNVIFSITASILSGLVEPEVMEDPELSQVYHNASAMVAFLINSNLSDRQDIALYFYPSRYQFYWMTSRTLSIMNSYKLHQEFPVAVMDQVFANFKQALEGEVTSFILSKAQSSDAGSTYFDDFLGNGDLTNDNKPIIRGEDRIFTTAMAANTLMYTWVTFDPISLKSYWKTGTPEVVKQTVRRCITWLVENALSGKFKLWSAFVGGPNYGTDDLPLRYPANLFIERPQNNETQLNVKPHSAAAMQGYVPKSQYETMINSTHFGQPTPTEFKGYNHPDFLNQAFWTSDAVTYAVIHLALTRYRAIECTV